ncbi:UDP-2,3-diacylglucosamine diphosphatase [Beggiatoa leptomitoformis]|uniref:UDP-2,3-diacylglucosamine diphosphatase n=1 Tax=Beggiatoa leptomitoformis TaxID=288004 RepID=A0A2N9YG08_9GAMM|nr:UDP-2,3-diacylglucosamine diphosphatase [Beggiatoa leptomitoformis]ALG68257.1 UDP-2,3-diacylglucosamine diphosphatase [Beggiatoa leptomitoformis]AUI69434.1 UDP-2,3-diacylglucosamine diphosphatase [Beggiatoa leptomitoformis]
MTPPIKHYRTIWLSDIHLGTRGCKADFLLDFLKNHESEYLYLVGDIIDGWRLKKSWYWSQSHNDVIQKVLRKARKGTKVFFIPGNHDEAARHFLNITFGDIHVVDEMVHTTADGRRLLVIHGDQFDGVIQYARWLALLGDWAYEMVLSLNHFYNICRRKLGYPYWSLSAYLKHKVKNAVNFITAFEQVLAEEARRRELDGVVCGHIHKAEIRMIDDVLYCNDGDWVESCTALIEDWDGDLFIVEWTDDNQHPHREKQTHENSDCVRRMVTPD